MHRNYDEYAALFAAATDDALINYFNEEVEKQGWTSSRADYLAALAQELKRRPFDSSLIVSDRVLSLKHRVRREAGGLVFVS